MGVAKLGAVVIATFALVWAAWLTSAGSLLGVLQRLAPLRRGLFEDYVANFWCVSSLFVKWKRLFEQQAWACPLILQLASVLRFAGLLKVGIHDSPAFRS